MPKPKKNKLDKFNKGTYESIFVQAKIPPMVYKNMIDSMDRLGLVHESTYLIMAIKSFNHKNS